MRVTFDDGNWSAVQEAVAQRMAELELTPRDLEHLSGLSSYAIAKLRGKKKSTGAMHLGMLRGASSALGWARDALADLAQGRITPEDLARADPSDLELHERFLRLERALRELYRGLMEIAQLDEERTTKMATVLAEVARLGDLLEAPDLIRVRLAAWRGRTLLHRADTVPSQDPDKYQELSEADT